MVGGPPDPGLAMRTHAIHGVVVALFSAVLLTSPGWADDEASSRTIDTHGAEVTHVAFDPSGWRLYSAASNGEIHAWNLAADESQWRVTGAPTRPRASGGRVGRTRCHQVPSSSMVSGCQAR